MNVTLIGIDLAKTVFQVCGVNRSGNPAFNHQMRRNRLIEKLLQYPEATIAMEACSGSNYWGRELKKLGKGAGYVQRQIGGWSDRFRKARTDDVGDFEEVMAWLNDKMPDDIAQVVIHNDYRFDNVVLNPDNPFEVIGVLDWEMATIGDPLMDLGNSLAYWIEADDEGPFQMLRRQPTHRPGMLTRKEVVDYYMEKSGFRAEKFDFYEIYGLFRLAVIIQQIYYRFYHGQTKDKRFAAFGHAANYLEKRCQRLISESTL